MLCAFLLVWAWLMIRRYELARAHQEAEEHARAALVVRAQKAAQLNARQGPTAEGGATSSPEVLR
jgi:hypothetical protein